MMNTNNWLYLVLRDLGDAVTPPQAARSAATKPAKVMSSPIRDLKSEPRPPPSIFRTA